MLRDITIGQHFPGNSLVHRFDPRLKLVLTVAYIVLLFAASNPLGLTLSILFLGVMYKVAKIPVKMIGKSIVGHTFLLYRRSKENKLGLKK